MAHFRLNHYSLTLVNLLEVVRFLFKVDHRGTLTISWIMVAHQLFLFRLLTSDINLSMILLQAHTLLAHDIPKPIMLSFTMHRAKSFV